MSTTIHGDATATATCYICRKLLGDHSPHDYPLDGEDKRIEVIVGKCGHTYHTACITRWVGTGREVCPLDNIEWEFFCSKKMELLDVDRCPICLEDMHLEPARVRVTDIDAIALQMTNTFPALGECGHTYHFECIVGWLWKSDRCPTCNEDWTFQGAPFPVALNKGRKLRLTFLCADKLTMGDILQLLTREVNEEVWMRIGEHYKDRPEGDISSVLLYAMRSVFVNRGPKRSFEVTKYKSII